MRSLGRRVRIDNSNSVLLTFDPIDLYAEEVADLEEVWLFANPALATPGPSREPLLEPLWVLFLRLRRLWVGWFERG